MTNQTHGQEQNDKRMRALTKAATVFSKLLEIAYWIGGVGFVVGLALFLLDPYVPGEWVFGMTAGDELSVQGFSMVVCGPDAQVIRPAMVIFLLTGAAVLGLMAFIFRNVNLILRTAQGLTSFSEGKTPFQKDNVRMVREIGIFFIAIMAVQFAMDTLAVCILGPEAVEVSVGMENLVIGILMLCRRCRRMWTGWYKEGLWGRLCCGWTG